MLLTLICSSCYAKQTSNCSFKESLNKGQLDVFVSAYRFNNNYFLLPAILYEESKLGLYKENPKSESYGVSHINIYTLLSRLNVDKSNKNKYKEKLINDDYFAMDMAKKELHYWYSIHHNRDDMIRSYNAGWKKERGDKYLTKINNTINRMSECSI